MFFIRNILKSLTYVTMSATEDRKKNYITFPFLQSCWNDFRTAFPPLYTFKEITKLIGLTNNIKDLLIKSVNLPKVTFLFDVSSKNGLDGQLTTISALRSQD